MDGTVQAKWLVTFPNSTLGDDPLDQLNIKLGIDYYKKTHKKLVIAIPKKCVNMQFGRFRMV